MSLKHITMGKKVAKKGVGAGGINFVKLSFALASAKLHLSPMSLFS
jgi:hypothetical protein